MDLPKLTEVNRVLEDRRRELHPKWSLSRWYDAYAELCKKAKKSPMSKESFKNRLGKGSGKKKRTPLDYSDLDDLARLHAFESFRILMDACEPAPHTCIAVIRKEDREPAISLEAVPGVRFFTPPHHLLRRIPTRIDVVEIDPGKETRSRPHKGHEFIFVQQGHIQVNFGAEIDRKVLKAGDSIFFFSHIVHHVCNVGKEKARLMVARPGEAPPLKQSPDEGDLPRKSPLAEATT
jgi:hypothetical protein